MCRHCCLRVRRQRDGGSEIPEQRDHARVVHRDVGMRRDEGEEHGGSLGIAGGDGWRESERVGHAGIDVVQRVADDGRLVDVADEDGQRLGGGHVEAVEVDRHHRHVELLQLLVVEHRRIVDEESVGGIDHQ